MSKRRLHFKILVEDVATGKAVRDSLVAKISTLPVFAPDAPASLAYVRGHGEEIILAVVGQYRFEAPDISIILRDHIKDLWSASAKVLAGSRIGIHTCSHEEELWHPCAEDDVVVKA